MPDWVPEPRLVILATGLCEIAGAAGLLSPPVPARGRDRPRPLRGLRLPGQPQARLRRIVHIDGLPDSWWYHGPRLAFQPVFVWAALWAGGLIDWPFRAAGRRSAGPGPPRPPRMRRPEPGAGRPRAGPASNLPGTLITGSWDPRITAGFDPGIPDDIPPFAAGAHGIPRRPAPDTGGRHDEAPRPRTERARRSPIRRRTATRSSAPSMPSSTACGPGRSARQSRPAEPGPVKPGPARGGRRGTPGPGGHGA